MHTADIPFASKLRQPPPSSRLNSDSQAHSNGGTKSTLVELTRSIFLYSRWHGCRCHPSHRTTFTLLSSPSRGRDFCVRLLSKPCWEVRQAGRLLRVGILSPDYCLINFVWAKVLAAAALFQRHLYLFILLISTLVIDTVSALSLRPSVKNMSALLLFVCCYSSVLLLSPSSHCLSVHPVTTSHGRESRHWCACISALKHTAAASVLHGTHAAFTCLHAHSQSACHTHAQAMWRHGRSFQPGCEACTLSQALHASGIFPLLQLPTSKLPAAYKVCMRA